MKKCLIIVDYQNDFVDGALGFKGAETLDDVITKKIETYLKEKQDIIFTFDTHDNDYLSTQEGRRLPIVHCVSHTHGHMLYGKTAAYLKDAKIVFNKPTFGSLELGNYLKTNPYDEVELCGLVTNMCVVSNAVIAKAALPEARIIVDHKACMSFNESLHEQTLNVLAGMQMDII